MKKTFLLAACCLAAHTILYAQADPSNGGSKDSLVRTFESFGGIASDSIDDSYAFYKAARFFSNLDTLSMSDTAYRNYIDYNTKYGILNFGTGTFDIGQQVFATSTSDDWHANPKYPAVFQRLNGLIIKGKTGTNNSFLTKIRLKEGAYFGYFERSTTSHTPKYPVSNDVQNIGGVGANPGMIFQLGWNAQNVIIRDLELDGRSNTYHVGYPAAPNSDYNCFSYGINSAAQFLSLENLYVHNFGEDGLRVEAAVAPAAQSGRQWNITMNNVRSLWNGRQALSWCHGRDVKIENSTFAYTRLREGHLDETPGPDSLLIHTAPGAPGCNVDIEPEYGYTDANQVYHPDLTVRNGLFNNCKIMGNYGPSASLAIQLYSDSITFNNCEIKGFTNTDPNKGRGFAAIGMQSLVNRTISFNNCVVRGTISFQRDNASGLSNTGLTKFWNCNIATNSIAAYTNEYPLIFAYDKVLFDKCTIERTTARPLIDIRPKNGIGTYNNPDNYTEFRNCNFISDLNNPAGGYIYDQGNIWFVRFTGNTSFVHSYAAPSVPYNNMMYGVTLNGSNMFSPMNTFSFSNHHNHLPRWVGWMYDIDPNRTTYPYIFGETPCEFLNINIGDGTASSNSSFINYRRPVYIGEGTTVRVKSGSALYLSGKVYLAGKIIVEPGAYFWCDSARFYHLWTTPLSSHIEIQPGALTALPSFVTALFPYIGASNSSSTYTATAVVNRSQLMAPQQFMKSAVNPSQYDAPDFKGCTKCYLQSDGSALCSSPGILSEQLKKSGVEAVETEDVLVYPNPTSDVLRLRLQENDLNRISLMDMNGKLLKAMEVQGGNTEISLKEYAEGHYLLRISNAKGTRIVKIQKQN